MNIKKKDKDCNEWDIYDKLREKYPNNVTIWVIDDHKENSIKPFIEEFIQTEVFMNTAYI